MSAAQDGRARAIEAAREGIKRRSWESWGDGDVPQTPGDFAEAAIDAALADGGVHAGACVPREAFVEVEHAYGRAARAERAITDALGGEYDESGQRPNLGAALTEKLEWLRDESAAQRDRADRAEGELYRLRLHAAMLADHVRGLVAESDRVEREGDDAEQDWTRPLIDMPVRKALERLMATLARLSKLWDSYPPADRVDQQGCGDHKHSQSFGRTHRCGRCGRWTFPPQEQTA